MGIVSNREHISKGTTNVQGIVASLVLPDISGFQENLQILEFFFLKLHLNSQMVKSVYEPNFAYQLEAHAMQGDKREE